MPVRIAVILVLLSSPGQTRQPVFDLSDRDCNREVLMSSIEGAEVFASCASKGDQRIMRISVSNLASSKEGPLREFSLGFCGPSVIEASAPSGWIATIEGDERQSVTWSLPNDLVDRLGIRSRNRVSGFLVRLKPGWKKSRSDSAWWGESHIVSHATTHDCP